MKIVTRTHRVLAILMGLIVLITLINQVWRDGRRMESKRAGKVQSIKK